MPRITRIEPAALEIPANTLRFYISFDNPARGVIGQQDVHLLNSDGGVVADAFIDFGQELWSPDGRRLTILLDPGAIKRGVRSGRGDDALLKPGEAYRLTMGEFEHPFRVVEAVRRKLDPAQCQVTAPHSGHPALSIAFDRVMDAAMLSTRVLILDASDRPVSVRTEVSTNDRILQVQPMTPWRPGNYTILFDPLLEDIAGNRAAAALEHTTQEGGPDQSSYLEFKFTVTA